MKKTKNINLFNLENKTALIIGGAGYLGFEMSKALFLMNAKVIIASRDIENFNYNMKKLKVEINKQKKIKFIKLDISKTKSINSFYKNLKKECNSKLDILINCAWNGKKNTLESISNKDWDHDINISLSSTFKITKKLLPLLKLSQGTIINIASMYGHVSPDYRIYKNKNVNSISPGAFPFPSTKKKFPEFVRELKKKAVLGRIGYPKDLNGITVLLCSDAGKYINGQNICVDGGWSVR